MNDDMVDEYINQFAGDVNVRLQTMRRVVRSAAPDAEESISYGMPAYKLHGKPLVYFAGYPGHVGFYATPTGHEVFKDDLAGYKQGKGSVRFLHSQPLPIGLVRRIVEYRYQEITKELSHGSV